MPKWFAFDRVGREAAAPLLPAIGFADRPEDVADGADAVVVVTEWDELARAEPPRPWSSHAR